VHLFHQLHAHRMRHAGRKQEILHFRVRGAAVGNQTYVNNLGGAEANLTGAQQRESGSGLFDSV
jgi:hypothetical protein